jgi:hypothetical protein
VIGEINEKERSNSEIVPACGIPFSTVDISKTSEFN